VGLESTFGAAGAKTWALEAFGAAGAKTWPLEGFGAGGAISWSLEGFGAGGAISCSVGSAALSPPFFALFVGIFAFSSYFVLFGLGFLCLQVKY